MNKYTNKNLKKISKKYWQTKNKYVEYNKQEFENIFSGGKNNEKN